MRWKRKTVVSALVLVLLVGGYTAVIILPNIARAIMLNKESDCVQEINSITVNLTRVCADAGTGNLRGLFQGEAFSKSCEERMARESLDAFQASTAMYTTLLTALLGHGRNAPEALSNSPRTQPLVEVFDDKAVGRLGTHYCDLRSDPWGEPYQIFAGPWPMEWHTIVLRTYIDDTPNAVGDTLTVEKESNESRRVGFPPSTSEMAYVWSRGPNRISDQAIFQPNGEYAPPAIQHYRPNAIPEYAGGGDDINNWDHGESWRDVFKSIPGYRAVWDALSDFF